MPAVCEHGKQRLLVNELRTKTVDHADRPRAVGIQQGRIVAHDRQVLVHQQALVNDVDLQARNAETVVAEFKFLWRADYRWIAGLLEEISEQFKLADCRHSRQIDNRDPRRLLWSM